MSAVLSAPATAAPGSRIKVTGSGFPADKVYLTLDGAGRTTNVFGAPTFEVWINVSTTVRVQTLIVCLRSTGKELARTSIKVQKTVEPPPPPPPVEPPPVIVPGPVQYAATYTAKGGDETAALKTFIEGNRGKRIGILGQVGVTSCKPVIPAGPVTIVDWLEGASLKALSDIAQATLFLQSCFDLELNDLAVVGRGYGTYHPNLQWQHGVGLYGGGRITLRRFAPTDTFGDGIDVDVNTTEATPVAVAIVDPKIRRACRNGITGNAGEVTVTGGSIDQTGLHGIDLEPNGDREALSIDFRVKGTRLTRASNMPVFDTPGQIIRGRAFSGLGYSAATKKRIEIVDCSSDDFQIAVDHAQVFTFTDNDSDTPVAAPAKTAFYFAMGTKTIARNTNIALVEYAFR